MPFPAGRSDDDASLSEQSLPFQKTTQQVASILQLPVSEGLSRIVADYLPSPGLSLVGEADAAKEWVDDPARNRKGQRMSLAFFRRWLQREVEAADVRTQARASPRAASASPPRREKRTGTMGAGPPADSTQAGEDPYAAYVRRREAEVHQRWLEERQAHEATS